MKLTKTVALIGALLLLSGCSNTSAHIESKSPPAVAGVAVSNSKGNRPSEPSGISGSTSGKTAGTVSQSDHAEKNKMTVTIGDHEFTITLYDNETTGALKKLLESGPLRVKCSNYGGFEKVCRLEKRLPSDDVQTKTKAGDVMLYSGNQIVIFYGSNSWAYTKIGRVDPEYLDQLHEILSGPETEIIFSIK